MNCFICRASEFKRLISQSPSMASDGRTVDFKLEKEFCLNCGTVRTKDTSFLPDFYKTEYTLNTSDLDPNYIFEGKTYTKSQMHFDWISELLYRNGLNLTSAKTIMEIGCGSGNLLGLIPLAERFGVEPSGKAALHASKVGNVRNIGFEEIDDSEKYDIVLTSCVIEHTTNPNEFLNKIGNILVRDGFAIVGLPIQDNESIDVFFLDHLHHFSKNQFIHLCNLNGFSVLDFEIGYKCITTLGYFILKHSKSCKDENFIKPVLKFEENVNYVLAKSYCSNLNKFLLKNRAQEIWAFGYGETSFFFQTYSQINLFSPKYIDDVRANDLNVFTTEQFRQMVSTEQQFCIILLTNPFYNDYIKAKFHGYENISFYSPF